MMIITHAYTVQIELANFEGTQQVDSVHVRTFQQISNTGSKF